MHKRGGQKSEFVHVRASERLWESLMRSEGTLESVDESRMLAVISASLRHMTRLLIKT